MIENNKIQYSLLLSAPSIAFEWADAPYLYHLHDVNVLFVNVLQLKCEEKDRNQLKVDEINRLEDALSKNIDKTSNHYMKRVTKPFHKRWNDAKMALDRYRNEDYPFIKPDDCFLIKCFKKALVVN